MKYILVTGGLGFIGSHTVVEIIQQTQYHVVIIDNLSNSKEDKIESIRNLVQRPQDIHLIVGDVHQQETLDLLFKTYPIEAVIHFAALKSVEESIQDPLLYFDHNISGTLKLLRTMERMGVYRLVFSSSATVYGAKHCPPYTEEMIIQIDDLLHPYGKTKAMMEKILQDLKTWDITILRYFNPIGSHPSGTLPENPLGVSKNIFPILHKIANNQQSHLNIFGADYPTKDGTAVRDYIHVVDVARTHVLALELRGHHTYNVGTGTGTTVLDLVYAYEKVQKTRLPVLFKNRREGDVPFSFCDASKIQRELGWRSEYTLEDMCQ